MVDHDLPGTLTMAQTSGVIRRVPFLGPFVLWCARNPLIAPALIFAIIITQAPFVLTIWFSFQKWNLLRPENSRFTGISNYVDIFQTSRFLEALLNTVVLTVSAVVISLLVGLLYAELVNHGFRGRGIVRTLLITPFLVMPVVGALAWKNMMLNPVFGVVDWLARSLGLPAQDWLAQYPLASIVVIIVWRWAPFMMLILLAGMQALSEEVREGARVDGATDWQEFRYIVLPHLKAYMQLGILLGSIYIVNEFDAIYMATQGGPGTASTNLPFLIYQTVFFGYDVGHSAAMAVIVVAITLVAVTYLLRTLARLMEGNN